MILVDSSVWIDYFNGVTTSETEKLRKLGVTARKTVDTFIATRCIENGYELLHSDKDFDPFAKHRGLRIA